MTSKFRRRFELSNQDYIEAFESARGVLSDASNILGVTPNAMRHRLGRMRRLNEYDFKTVLERFHREDRAKAFELPKLPEPSMPVEELIEKRKREFSYKQAYEEAVKLIPIKVKLDGPIGILHFGDPHLDDDGTDLSAIEEHCRLVRETEGLFAACVGDLTNNWVGRLAKLWAEQGTSAQQAWQLAEWYLGLLQGHLLYLIGGNHDMWSGPGDPLKWIMKQKDALYKSSEVRLELRLPGGQKPRINARHDFEGHSQWNPAHGAMKALTLGVRDHMAVCGHRHISAYSALKCPETGIVMHAIRVATYKIYDRYAMDRGFRDQSISPCALTTINTNLPENAPDYVKLFWDPGEGAEYLKFLRR